MVGALRIRTPRAVQDLFAWLRRQLPNLDPKELMPIGIDVTKGVILCGNNSTPSLLVAEFESTNGTFGITRVGCLMRGIDCIAYQRVISRGPNSIYTSSCLR